MIGFGFFYDSKPLLNIPIILMHDSISIQHIAWKNVTRKIFRNIILVIAVSILVALLVFAMLFNNSVEQDIEQATKKLGADIVLVPAEAKSLAEEFILESSEKTFYMDEFILDAVKVLPEIESVTYQIYLDTIESGCCSIEEGQVVIFNTDTDFVVTPWLVEQDLPPLKKGEVYVGDYVWEYLGLLRTATLFDREMKIAGHLQYTGTGLDRGIFVQSGDLDTTSEGVRGQFKKGQISIAFLKVKDGVDPEAVALKVAKINPNIGIMTRGSIGGGIRSTLKDILRIFSITILTSSLLAILLAWSTFTALANERKREVGIMRAIGARQFHILKMFLTEAMIISLLGGLLGVGIGHYMIHYLAKDFNLLSRLDALTAITSTNIIFGLVALTIGIMVCLLGALMPIVRLARMEPLLAIKEE